MKLFSVGTLWRYFPSRREAIDNLTTNWYPAAQSGKGPRCYITVARAYYTTRCRPGENLDWAILIHPWPDVWPRRPFLPELTIIHDPVFTRSNVGVVESV